MICLANKTDLLGKKFFFSLRGKWIVGNVPDMLQVWIIGNIIMVSSTVAMVRQPTTVVQA